MVFRDLIILLLTNMKLRHLIHVWPEGLIWFVLNPVQINQSWEKLVERQTVKYVNIQCVSKEISENAIRHLKKRKNYDWSQHISEWKQLGMLDDWSQHTVWLITGHQHTVQLMTAHSEFLQTHNIGNSANIGIRGFTTWKQKNQVTKCYLQWRLNPDLWLTSDSKSNTLLSQLIWHVLLKRSLNFCLCITWFLDLVDLVGVNRAWLLRSLKSQSYQEMLS